MLLNSQTSEAPDLTRRKACVAGAAALWTTASALMLAGSVTSASANDTNRIAEFWRAPRWVDVKRPQTGETVRAVYWRDGVIQPQGYAAISHALRDLSANESIAMDVNLLDALYAICGWLREYGVNPQLNVTSGYRTRKTNHNIEGAAKNSAHLLGRATDFHVLGLSTDYLARLAAYLQSGGVGYYPNRLAPNKEFVHLEIGRVRVWTENRTR